MFGLITKKKYDADILALDNKMIELETRLNNDIVTQDKLDIHSKTTTQYSEYIAENLDKTMGVLDNTITEFRLSLSSVNKILESKVSKDDMTGAIKTVIQQSAYKLDGVINSVFRKLDPHSFTVETMDILDKYFETSNFRDRFDLYATHFRYVITPHNASDIYVIEISMDSDNKAFKFEVSSNNSEQEVLNFHDIKDLLGHVNHYLSNLKNIDKK